MKLLSINNVTIRYGVKVAVQDACVDILSDDFTGVIGPNGGGKTSLIKAVLGLVPYEGKIEFAPGMSADNGTIGYLPQQNNFDRSFPISVREIILSGLQSGGKMLNRFSSVQKEKAAELMRLTGISHLAGKSAGELSGGELQRALLCRALISDPRLLILDEPATYVDNRFESELYEILRQLNDRMAIVMVSHDIGTITSFVKSIICVNRTVHRHDTGELTVEMLENYNCPIQLVSHGDIPHTTLRKHR
jgi:zinc transport system ATP-binding protein